MMQGLLWLIVFIVGPVVGAGNGCTPTLPSDIVREMLQSGENLHAGVVAALTLGEIYYNSFKPL